MTLPQTTPFSLQLPTKVRFAPQASAKVLEEARAAGFRHAAALVDAGALAQPTVQTFLDEAKQSLDLRSIVEFDGGEPTYAKLEEMRPAFMESSPECILAIGGGSVMDVGKAMAVLVTNDGPALSYRGFDQPTEPALPIITVPTIAGTGSEITPNASFVDQRELRKMGINGDCVRPALAIIDPCLALSCPPRPTMCSAVDSLVHATEAYVARKATPIARLFAREAFSLVCFTLEQALDDPEDLDSRCSLALGSLYAAIAMMNSGTGPAAAMSYPMGVRYSVPHGFAGAVFLPIVADLTREAGCLLHDELTEDQVWEGIGFSEMISALWRRIGMPSDLQDLGVRSEEEEAFVQDVLELSAALDQHPTPFGKTQIMESLRRLRGPTDSAE